MIGDDIIDDGFIAVEKMKCALGIGCTGSRTDWAKHNISDLEIKCRVKIKYKMSQILSYIGPAISFANGLLISQHKSQHGKQNSKHPIKTQQELICVLS
jgi:hypothetical protein